MKENVDIAELLDLIARMLTPPQRNGLTGAFESENRNLPTGTNRHTVGALEDRGLAVEMNDGQTYRLTLLGEVVAGHLVGQRDRESTP